MSDLLVNRVVVDGQVELDLTGDSVTENKVLSGVTFHKRTGERALGIILTRPASNKYISNKDVSVQIPEGYYPDEFSVGLFESEKVKLIPANIRSGINLLGIAGSFLPFTTYTTAYVVSEGDYYVLTFNNVDISKFTGLCLVLPGSTAMTPVASVSGTVSTPIAGFKNTTAAVGTTPAAFPLYMAVASKNAEDDTSLAYRYITSTSYADIMKTSATTVRVRFAKRYVVLQEGSLWRLYY